MNSKNLLLLTSIIIAASLYISAEKILPTLSIQPNGINFYQSNKKREQKMITIAQLKESNCAELKEFLLKVAYNTWQPSEEYSQFSYNYYHSSEFHDIDNFEKTYTNNRGVFLLIFDKDNTIIGSGAIKRIDDIECELKRMFIDTRYHRKGLGTQLILELLDFAQQHGYKKVTLEIWQPAKQEAALNFYKKFGFQIIDPLMHNHSSHLYMKKDL